MPHGPFSTVGPRALIRAKHVTELQDALLNTPTYADLDTPIVLKGVLDSTALLPASDNEVSDAYLVNGTIWVWDGAAWTNQGSISHGTNGDDGLDGQDGEGVITSVTDGVGEWWIHPVATYQDAPYPRTVFGAVSRMGDLLACEFNHGTGRTKRYDVANVTRDDHNVPALWVMDGHRTVIAWTNHGAAPPDGGSAWDVHIKAGSIRGDLGSLVGATEYTIGLGNPASYTQVHRIENLSSATEDYFWCFSRRASVEWCIRPFVVNQDTGVITFPGSRIQLLVTAGELCYVSTADAHNASGNQVIRVGFGYNPAETTHEIRLLEIDCVTGAITSPNDPGISANVAGTNLPITDSTITPVIDDVAGGLSRRFFYTRPGPDGYAFAYAEWTIGDEDNATYYVTEYTPATANALVPGTGYAQADYNAALDADAGGFSYTVVVKTPSSTANNLELGRRLLSPTGGWFFRLTTDKKLNHSIITNAGTSAATTTAAAPFTWGDTVGFRLTANPTTDQVRRYYSINPLAGSPTWTELDSALSFAFSTVNLPTSQPLIVPTNNASFDGIPEVYEVAYLDNTGATIASADFAADWTPGSTTYTDPQGREWSLSGVAEVPDDTYTTYSLGIAGARVGYTAAANYIPGLAFENPSYDRAVLRARSDGTTETVEKLRLVGGSYVAEVLETQATVDGRLIRPYQPVNGGPFAVLITNITQYADYTNFTGDVRGVS